MFHIRIDMLNFTPPPPRDRSLTKPRRASTLLALSVLIALTVLLSLTTSAAAQTPAVDYDTNDDGYISVANLAQLNAIRHDLNGNGARDSVTTTVWANYTSAFPNAATGMGCPATGCVGYELTASLDFDSDSDGDVDANDHSGNYWDSGKGWLPIGTGTARYTGDFKGNGNTINNLFISRRTTLAYVGLFGAIASGSRIETLGVTNADVRGNDRTGILVGQSHGTIVACYTTGKVQSGSNSGGLVGRLENSSSAIHSSYSTAYVDGGITTGGLVGNLRNGSITNSYSTGRISGTLSHLTGGLLGTRQAVTTAVVTASYWDTSTSGTTTSAGGSGVVGKTTRQLQTPTGYTGIYANWNTNLDGDTTTGDAMTGNDDPWTFGNKMQYPMLDYKGMSINPQGGQAMGIPDNWNHPIVGELVGVCLNAATFPNRATHTVAGQTTKKPWIWERSDNGDTWETISGTTAPTYQYTPTTADVNHFLRAKVELAGGAFAYTRNLGGRVKNASDSNDATQGSAITFVSGNASPRVGTEIVASDPRPSGATGSRSGWQRCPNATAPHTDCSYITHNWLRYTPVAADVGNYLRFYVYYETSAGVWTRHVSGYTGQVAASQ